ncbi:MAG: EndoU domain-containing protein [Micromonosporaceae bacterium]
MYGDEDDEESGGHLYGTGRPGKTEFPPDWDEDDCIGGVLAVARAPQEARERRNGSWRVQGTHRGVLIRAFVRPDGTIAASHPISGPGVWRNPRRPG